MEVRKGRVGKFFLTIGLILLVIFFVIDQEQGSQVGFFFSGIFIAGLGVYMIWRDWKRPDHSERFRTVRRLRRKPKENQARKD
jgi:amino acid transporter